MIEYRIAKRYAKALQQVGSRTGLADRLGDELNALEKVVTDVPGLEPFLADRTVPSSAKGSALKAILGAGDFSQTIRRFLDLVLQYDRAALLPVVAKVYRDLQDEAQGVLRGTVLSAEALSSDELDRIRGSLAKATGRTVELTTETDANLLAGFRIQLEDVVLDATVRGQLRTLQHDLQRSYA